ncbi:MAG: transposase [Tyzzerella sp.]|nr:transposase [Tyzzerella sp.]
MPHRARKESSTGVYHVFVRGINHELIFNQTREKCYFKKIIKKHLIKYDIEIYAYCIMSSHAHFIIKSQDIQEMSMFMSKVLAEYASYYNYKKNRNGHVFQGRFRSECIEDSHYYWTCLKYIHMNPVKAHMVSAAWEYRYSSINDYKNERTNIIHENGIKQYKQKFANWQQFMEYHYGRNASIFLGMEQEVYLQQKDMAWDILYEMQALEEVEHVREVLEEPEMRKRYLNLLKERMQISETKKKKLYEEIKKELLL